MNFKEWLGEAVESPTEVYNLCKQTDTDDVDTWERLADALEDLSYPNINNLRNALDRLKVAHIQGMDKKGTYDGVYWEIRQRVIRLQTEVQHWLARYIKGVQWSGPYQQ